MAWAAEAEGAGPPGVMDILLLPRVWVGIIFCVAGLILLLSGRATRNVRVAILPVIFFVFGVLAVLPLGSFARGMGLHPSPVCAITRPFQFIYNDRSIPVMFFTILGVIGVLSIAGNKLFCGWVCPLGAIQELVHRIPIPGRLRTVLPFGVTNAVRILVFVAFVIVVFITGTSIYDYFNPFEFFHWSWELIAGIALLLTLLISLAVFRPFCYLACPIGLATWLLEHVSIVRIRLDREACTDCDLCVKKGTCPAVAPILAGKKSRPDCHACGDCINICPKGALKFK
jgi:polyferredoxin